MYRVLIVEDSPDEAETLRGHLQRYAGETGLRFSIETMSTAFEFVSNRPEADLIFMDIDLPGINGMEAAEALREDDRSTPLIFVTNLAQYAVRGYQVDALDFMVKPVRYGDFAMRMQRAMRVLERNARQTIAVSTTSGTRVIDVRDLAYVDLRGHDLHYHMGKEVAATSAPSELQQRGSVREIEKRLPENEFIKVSQGCLANMAHVSEVRADSILMDDGVTLYFSRSRRRECLEKLTRYFGGSI